MKEADTLLGGGKATVNTGFGFGGHFLGRGQGNPRRMTPDSRESHGDFDFSGRIYLMDVTRSPLDIF